MIRVYFTHFTPAGKIPKKDNGLKFKVNEEINAKELRVVDDEGKLLGLMSSRDALKIAEERQLDLIEIAPQAVPPVCKIIDFGKFAYEQQKKEKHQRKQQQQQQMKEIRFKPRTALHDFKFKSRHAINFIEEGNKVKASVMFRGREITHQQIGQELLERFIIELDEVAKVDSPLRFEGKVMSVIMAPDKTKKKK